MKIFLAFSGEGSTDERFFTKITDRILEEFFLERNLTIEISWTPIKKKGSSFESIRDVSKKARELDLAIIHRDSDKHAWDAAHLAHFEAALNSIRTDTSDRFNRCIIPLIPVKETEAWMLVDKVLLKSKIGTSQSNNKLGLTYQVQRIEEKSDPKAVIENAIKQYKLTLPPKRRRYAPKLSDLYLEIATEVDLEDLKALDSYNRYVHTLYETVESILETT